MRASNVLGMIYSSIYDEQVSELTGIRTMGSIPFAGRYRLIDLCLSGMVNCGITKVGVSTKSNYRSLMDHLGSGKAWDLSRKRGGLTLLPPFNVGDSSGIFSHRLEALKGMMDYISHSDKDYILFCDCNVVCNIDYEKFIEAHLNSGADITIAYKRGVKPAIADIMTFDLENDKIVSARTGELGTQAMNYSLNIIIMSRALTERLVNSAATLPDARFESAIIANNVQSLDIRGYKIEEFAEMVDSLQSYYDISMRLLSGGRKELFKKDRPIYTKVRDDVPAIYGVCSKASDSLIADGCVIKGTVENCILFRGVYVAEDAVVKNSVIMQDSYISAGAKINCAILDKNVVIRPNREISGAESYPVYIGKNITV